MLCREAFGANRGSIMFGWVFAADMIGASPAAVVSVALRSASGDHMSAWVLAGALAVTAAVASPTLPRAQPAPTNNSAAAA